MLLVRKGVWLWCANLGLKFSPQILGTALARTCGVKPHGYLRQGVRLLPERGPKVMVPARLRACDEKYLNIISFLVVDVVSILYCLSALLSLLSSFYT